MFVCCRYFACFYIFVSIVVNTCDAQNDTETTTASEFKYAKYFKNISSINNATIPDAARDVISQVITKKCSHHYSFTCLKLDLSKLLDKLVSTKSFQIFPGISLVHTENNATSNRSDNNMPVNVAVSLVRSNNNSSELNSYLLQKIGNYVGSLSVRVNLLDNPVVQNLKNVGYGFLHNFFHPIEETGRKKGKQDMHAAVWSAAMLAALAFAALAALAGKAMLTGALALVLSLVCLLKGCGHGHRASHYEIITKPAHMHDVEHVGYASALGSSPYAGYARQLLQDRIIPAINLLDNGSEEKDHIVREVIPITYQMSQNNMNPNPLVHR